MGKKLDDVKRMEDGRRVISCADHAAMDKVIARLAYIVNMAIERDKNAVDSFAQITLTTPTLIELHSILHDARESGRAAFRKLDEGGWVCDSVSPRGADR